MPEQWPDGLERCCGQSFEETDKPIFISLIRRIPRENLKVILVKFYRIILTLAGIILLPGFLSAGSMERSPKLLLIHLDAVSYYALIDEIEAGNLPNIQRIFKDEDLLQKAITYYPSKTPFVISNIRNATKSDAGELVAWEIPGYDFTKTMRFQDSFIKMAMSKSRLARANLLYGIPFFNKLADLALMNTLDLFDEYPVQEFYWYKVDSYGHLKGEEEYLKKIREFDVQIGKYINELDDDINIIIYADHGMIFGEGVDIEKTIKEEYSNKINTYSYPTIFLYDKNDSEEIARQIVTESELDFAFFLNDETSVKGYFEDSVLYFDYKDRAIRYTHEGHDPFHYYENGYNGEYMTANEWLSFSIDMEYPATPVKVYAYLKNPHSGDIVTSLDGFKYNQTPFSRFGNHGGFSATEVIVPVLVRGPNVGHIGKFGELWLQDLFDETEIFTFNQKPNRDSHYISSRYSIKNNNTQVSTAFSPTYRYRLGVDLELDSLTGSTFDIRQAWGKFDAYRSYLARLWFGAGLDFSGERAEVMAMMRHEFRYRQFSTRTSLTTSGNNRFTLGYDLSKYFTLELTNFANIGFRLSL